MTRKKRLEITSCDMERFSKLPKDYDKFVNQAVFKMNTYIFYNKKENIAYCSGCKLKLKNMELKHNKNCTCPNCGRMAIAKSTGYAKNLTDVGWSVIVEENDGDLLFQYVRSERTYKDYVHPVTKTVVKQRTVLSADKLVYPKDYEFDEVTNEWRNYRKPFNTCTGPGIYKEPIKGCYLYNLDIKELIENNDFKYSSLETAIDLEKDKNIRHTFYTDKHLFFKYAYFIENYLMFWKNHKYIDQILKAKHYDLGKDIIENRNMMHCTLKEKSKLNEILCLSKADYKELVKIPNFKCKEVYIMQTFCKNGYHLNADQVTKIQYGIDQYAISYFIDLLKRMSFEKAMKYVEYIGKSSIGTYCDYLEMAEKLKWNLKKDNVKFPKDLKKAHDLAVSQFNKLKKRKFSLEMKSAIQSCVYNFEKGNLKIVVPETIEDIVKEGQALNHCVATYIDRVALGKTMILFIRKRSNLKKPYYTLEWKFGINEQCHGFNNEEPTEEVQEFIDLFEEKMHGIKIKAAG